MTVTDIRARMHSRLPSSRRFDGHVDARINPKPANAEGIEVVFYQPACIHEGVAITTLLGALNRHGLTWSNVAGRGLVIHCIGQDPERPAPDDTEAG